MNLLDIICMDTARVREQGGRALHTCCAKYRRRLLNVSTLDLVFMHRVEAYLAFTNAHVICVHTLGLYISFVEKGGRRDRWRLIGHHVAQLVVPL